MNNKTWVDYRKEEVVITSKYYAGYCLSLDCWRNFISKRLMEIIY